MEYQVDIVVPVYNEPENLPVFYEYIARHVASTWRMLVVYDFAEDTTLPILKEIASRDPRVIPILSPQGGVLNATKTGFARAESTAVLELAVDDSPTVLEKIDDLVRIFYAENATIVALSRYMPGGKREGGPRIKAFISRFACLSLRWLTGIPTHDATYTDRLYRRSFLQSITIESTRGLEIALEITVKAHAQGEKIIEIPVHWSDRTVGVSRFKVLEWMPAYFRWYWYGIKTYWAKRLGLKKS